MKRGRARIFKLSSYAEFRERGCARMCWSSRYADLREARERHYGWNVLDITCSLNIPLH
jgi:hypothetical protein